MANQKVSCLRKGVVVGRIGQALSELHIEIDVAGETNVEVSRGALGEIKNSLSSLRKNFRGSSQEVHAIGEGVKKVTKLLRGKKPTLETMDMVKAELKEIRSNFRKTVLTGFTECGAHGPYNYQMVELIDDNAHYHDTHPEAVPPA